MEAEGSLCTGEPTAQDNERLPAELGPTLPSGKAPGCKIHGSGMAFGGMFSSGCWPFFLSHRARRGGFGGKPFMVPLFAARVAMVTPPDWCCWEALACPRRLLSP